MRADIHDVSVQSGAMLNVVTRGRGQDVNLDHHRQAPFANLFTDYDMGFGTRPFGSAGASPRGHTRVGQAARLPSVALFRRAQRAAAARTSVAGGCLAAAGL